MVICIENIFGEEEGTFPNPVAQLDRTTLAIYMADPEDEADEAKIMARNVVGKKVEKLTNLHEVAGHRAVHLRQRPHIRVRRSVQSEVDPKYQTPQNSGSSGADGQGVHPGRHLAARPPSPPGPRTTRSDGKAMNQNPKNPNKLPIRLDDAYRDYSTSPGHLYSVPPGAGR